LVKIPILSIRFNSIIITLVRQGRLASYERREDMDEMATNTEYILRMVLELIDKCKTLDELREAVKAVLDETK
jgi:hypothetical protein